MLAFAMVAQTSFNSKIIPKVHFPIGHFMSPCITNAEKGSLKFLRTLFDRYLDHMLVKFKQNRMIQSIQNFKLFGKKWLIILRKRWRHFGRWFCDLNNNLMLNVKDNRLLLFQKYDSPTPVTRLKVAPNMTDAAVLMKTYRSLIDQLMKNCITKTNLTFSTSTFVMIHS